MSFVNRHLTINAISQTKPIRVTYTLDDENNSVVNGDRVRATDFYAYPTPVATGMEQLNNRLFVAQNCTATTFDLYDIQGQPIDGTAYTALTGLGVPQMTVTGPDLLTQNNG